MKGKTKFKEGSICWVDLATTDSAKAKEFYKKVLGYTYEDIEGDNGTYTYTMAAGERAGALYAMGKEMKGVPPHWTLYVAVNDVDAKAKKAKDLGGTVLMPPFDLMDKGRMTVVSDPTGGTLALWQAGKNSGFTTTGEQEGSFCWAELLTTNTDIAGKFYANLFGWKAEGSSNAGMKYIEWVNAGEHIGGMMNITTEMGKMPTCWSAYFLTTDVKKTAAKAEKAGGIICMGPKEIPGVGQFAVIQDPQKAVFNLFQASASPKHKGK